MKNTYTIKREKDLDFKNKFYYHLYINGKFELTFPSLKAANLYIQICEEE